ncbi:MAG: hypothetical protein ABIS47_11205 [Acidimicrobiales bacterium]
MTAVVGLAGRNLSRTPRLLPRARLVPAALAALLVVGLTTSPGRAGGDAEVLRRAQAASSTVAFEGTVVVRWFDGDGARHEQSMPVRGNGGELELGAGVQQPALSWTGGVGTTRNAPDPTSKYQVRAELGPLVLDRPTTRVLLDLDGRLTEEADVDDASGLLLRRQVYDARGATVRVVEFTALEGLQAASPAGQPLRAAWKVPRVDEVPRPFRAPDQLAGGYARLGAYRRGPAVQVLYGDGVRTLSVFSQLGEAEPSALPAGGELLSIGAAPGRRWTWAGGQVVTWSHRGITTTVVGDGPPAEVLTAARSLPDPIDPDMLAHLRQGSRRVIRVLV